MEKKPCQCCKDGKPGLNGGGVGYGYNRLEGEDRIWAANHRFYRSEYCVPVKEGKRFGGKPWVKIKCGDGRMGFSTRRKGQDEVSMEVGLDGQLKKRRHSLVMPKSARCSASRRARRVDGSKCGLASSVEIQMAARDPIVVAQQKRVSKKSKRAKNRNGVARRGHQRATRAA